MNTLWQNRYIKISTLFEICKLLRNVLEFSLTDNETSNPAGTPFQCDSDTN